MAWDNAVVTNAGIGLLQQVLEGKTLILDYAAGGSGTVNAASLITQTALKNKKQDFTIVGSTNVSNGKRINVQISNRGLTNSYPMQQLGIWAHVGTAGPVLFAILQDDAGAAIPAEASLPEFSMNFYAVVDFSNAASFKVVIDPATLVTLGAMTEYVDNALQAKVDKIPGKGLSTNDYSNAEKEKVAQIDNKVEKVTGKGLSTNDYSNAEKTKVATIDNKVDKVAGKGLSTNDFTDAKKEELETATETLADGTAIPVVSFIGDANGRYFGTISAELTVGMIITAKCDSPVPLSVESNIAINLNDTSGEMIKVSPDGEENHYFPAGSNPFKQGPLLLQLVKDSGSYKIWRAIGLSFFELSKLTSDSGLLPIKNGGTNTDWGWLSNNDNGLVSINKSAAGVLEYTYTQKPATYNNSFLAQGPYTAPFWLSPYNAANVLSITGTWNPTLSDLSDNPLDILRGPCSFIKNGKMVYLSFNIHVLSTLNASSAVYLKLSSLPLPVDQYEDLNIISTVFWEHLQKPFTNISMSVHSNDSFYFSKLEGASDNNSPEDGLVVSDVTAGSLLRGAILYYTNV